MSVFGRVRYDGCCDVVTLRQFVKTITVTAIVVKLLEYIDSGTGIMLGGSTMHCCPADWIGTLSFCVSLTCAPLSVGFIRSLGTIHGYRVCGLLGTGVLAASCIGSSFVQQPEWLFLTHSLLYGAGSSLVYMASSLVIGDHFRKDHKYHVLATSILLCGYPLGTCLFLYVQHLRYH